MERMRLLSVKSKRSSFSVRFIILAIFIVLLGFFLRFFQLGNVPGSLNWDEVSWGYNAYAIATTGKDEHGMPYPLSFKAFGDYKQPMYVYLDAIPTAIFGLTAFATRFPSALFGSLSVLIVFLLVYEMFYSYRYRNQLAMLSMLLFALSPWSIQFSRVAFEANIGVFFTMTGVWLFLRGFRLRSMWLSIVSVLVLSLSCYTYHSQKLFTPMLFAILLWYARSFLLQKRIIFALLIGVFFLMNIAWIADMRTTSRGRSVMFTSEMDKVLGDTPLYKLADREDHNPLGLVFHTNRLVVANRYIEQYLSHFDFNFLFTEGDNPRHHPPLMGVLYLVSFPFIIIGLISLIRNMRQQSLLLVPWLLLAPVAAALAINAPNASRSLVFLPVWQILAALGILTMILSLKKVRVRYLVSGFILLAYSLNFFYFIHTYFAHTDSVNENPIYWQYGYEEMVVSSPELEKQKPVIFAPDVEQGYIFYLFYNNIQPAHYFSPGVKEQMNDSCLRIQNAYFGDCIAILKDAYVYSAKIPETTSKVQTIKTITYPDGSRAFSLFSLTEGVAQE